MDAAHTLDHLKHGVLDDLNQPHSPARIPQPARLEDRMAGSPLIEVIFPGVA